MNINKHNYEAFFLDYHEGTLTPQQVADLLLFVEQHPELKEEFESFENVSFEDSTLYSFENKNELKKDLTPALSKEEGEKKITIENCENYFIRSVEGRLTITEENLLTIFLKQHPQFLTDLELFRKTKLSADTSIVFENKEQLKEIALVSDHLLIASVEGLLTNQETAFLNHQLEVDAEMKQNHALYQQTKLKADATIVFENKEVLKRREKRVIPFYYYVAAAAAILLLFGLFSIFNTTKIEKSFADKNAAQKHSAPINNSNLTSAPEKNIALNNTAVSNAVHIKKGTSVKVNTSSNENNPAKQPVNETPLPVADNVVKESPVVIPNNQVIEAPKNNSVVSTNADPVAIVEKKNESGSTEFLSLGQIATEKIKEKTLDAGALASEKKTGRLKKFSGWDMLQVVAKGVSKVTGKKVEVKPTYNDDGDVTAYALSAGAFGISKGK
jgi:hypothetical protein